MSNKISELKTNSLPTQNAYLPLIDGGDGNWENYKLKIIDYFYNKSEIDSKVEIIEKNLGILDDNLTDGNNTIYNVIKELEKKQNRNIEVANKVIISDGNNIITTSTITTNELNFLANTTDNIQAQLNKKAPLNSPSFTGKPTAPTPLPSSNDTRIATTNFVHTALMNMVPDYTAGVKYQGDTDHTMERVGWCLVDVPGRSGGKLTINGVELMYWAHWYDYTEPSWTSFIVGAGDIINATQGFTFFPIK